MEKGRVLYLSTGCVNVETASALNESAFTNTALSNSIVVYMKGMYGWFVYVPEDIETLEIPDDLRQCMRVAKAQKCEWIIFDRDVEYDESTGLPKYNW